MIAHYRGYEIKVTRERDLGGWRNLYFYIMRESDGRYLVDEFSTGEDRIQDFIGYMKERIDAELASDDPWGEKSEMAGWSSPAPPATELPPPGPSNIVVRTPNPLKAPERVEEQG